MQGRELGEQKAAVFSRTILRRRELFGAAVILPLLRRGGRCHALGQRDHAGRALLRCRRTLRIRSHAGGSRAQLRENGTRF